MARQEYKPHNYTQATLELLGQVDAVLDEYQELGYVLTLRQLYYQLVARAQIENSQRSYKRLVSLVSNARLSGDLDWDMITDRGRHTVENPHWEKPTDILEQAARQFQIDKWLSQPHYVEVICEKDALSSVLEPVCSRLDVPFTAAKGYLSLSTMRDIAQRMQRQRGAGVYATKPLHVIYLGDHDPSGLDMVRDVEDRLTMFLEGKPVTVHHAALTWDQVQDYGPPPNPAKVSDSRFRDYALAHGYESWELDALPPQDLAGIVEGEILDLLDYRAWDTAAESEKLMRDVIAEYAQAAKDRFSEEG